jgi:hypothetical protein
MDTKKLIEQLEIEWDLNGFLGQLRQGNFVPKSAAHFLDLLREVDILREEVIPTRLLSLLWYLPSFLAWQRERVVEKGGDVNVYTSFVTDVHNTLEDVLGAP